MEIHAGQTLPFMVGKPDAPHVYAKGQILIALICLRDPTAQEKAEFSKATRVLLAVSRIDGITMLAIKTGDMQWMDMPYHPMMALTRLAKPEGRYALRVALVDTMNGLVLAVAKTEGMPEDLSTKLYEYARQDMGPFDYFAYTTSLNAAMASFETQDVVRLGLTGQTVCTVSACFGESPVRPSLRGLAHGPCLHPESVPEALREYAVYIPDSGDCVLAIPTSLRAEAEKGDPYLYEVPVPVDMALRHRYLISGGHVFMDVRYDDTLGLVED